MSARETVATRAPATFGLALLVILIAFGAHASPPPLPAEVVSTNDDPLDPTMRPPNLITIANVGDDAFPDLITVVSNDATVSVLLGNGDGSFALPSLYPVADPTFIRTVGIAIADLDGDGIPDLATANREDQGGFEVGNVSVLLGNADGSFRAPASFPAGPACKTVAIADINGDSIPDLITANDDVLDQVSLLVGNGDGTFQSFQTVSMDTMGGTPVGAAAIDLNDDATVDLLTVWNGVPLSGLYGVSVRLGNGDGSFQSALATETPSSTAHFTLFDADLDGNLDVVEATLSNIQILLGNGDGTFEIGDQMAADSVSSLAATDVDSDGFTDLVLARFLDGLSVRFGTGDGSFGPQDNYEFGSAPREIAAGDLDGDGVADIVSSVDRSQGSVRSDLTVLIGNGDGTFSPRLVAGFRSISGTRTDKIALEFNGDGHIDLINLVRANGEVTTDILLGDGSGHLLLGPEYTLELGLGSAPASIAAAGPLHPSSAPCPDLAIAAEHTDRVLVVENINCGEDIEVVTYRTGGSSSDISIADVNGDSVPDIVTPDQFNPIVNILPGVGDGTFGDVIQTPLPPSAHPECLVVDDFDLDGTPDFAVAYGTTLAVVFRGPGASPPAIETTGSGPNEIAAGHLNGDAFPDLVTANFHSNSLSVFLGGAGGVLSPLGDISLVDATPNDIKVDDIDGDGNADLIVGRSLGNMMLLLGQGDGSFDAPRSFFSNYSSRSVVAADFNNDSRLDVVAASSTLLGRNLPEPGPTTSWLASVATLCLLTRRRVARRGHDRLAPTN